jgi:CheY-like chemotaxis protein
VLIVDDEEIVRMVMVETLADQGFAVLEAKDGESGLSILQSDKPISLLVTDVGLPGTLNGRQMADAARALRPDLKVLFITGYADAEVMAKAGAEPDLEILPKPFELDVLAARVGQMLGAG